MLDDRFGHGLISISPNDKSRRCLKLFMKYLIVPNGKHTIGQS